jgi:hypothetical protein
MSDGNTARRGIVAARAFEIAVKKLRQASMLGVSSVRGSSTVRKAAAADRAVVSCAKSLAASSRFVAGYGDNRIEVATGRGATEATRSQNASSPRPIGASG